MKLEKIQINGFGKLKDKSVEFKDGINIVVGNNESGKSTLLKFINSMFYGISKSKRGKSISDSEKYRPWSNHNYSGKIQYKLDNNKKFEIYRDFNNKELKIYNNYGDDITALFKVEKNKEIPFFYEQTKIDEDLFLNSTEIVQGQIMIDKLNQSLIIQKISNLATTGKDNISFKKSMEKLNKKQLEEIGTDRSQDRPINKIINKIEKLKKQKIELEKYEDEKYNIEKEDNLIKKKLKELNSKILFLNKLKIIKNIYLKEKENCEINKKIIEDYNLKIKGLEIDKEKININKKENKKINISKYFFIEIILILIIFLINFNLQQNMLYFLVIIPLIIYNFENKKINSINRKNKRELKNNINKIEDEIEILNENKKNKINELNNIENNINKKIKLESLKNNMEENKLLEFISNDKLEKEIILINEEINNKKLEEHKLELNKKNIFPKLDCLANIEEEIEYAEEEYEELKRNSEIIDIAKEYLNLAYKNMKENVTPKFANELSRTIFEISDGKYGNIKLNDNGIMVETKFGNYVPVDVLSRGTIEQLYFSLRMAILEEITEETLPIFLDESFVFFDSDRLINTISYLKNKKDIQIIIFSCNSREKNILDKLKIKYNLITL